MEDGAFDFEQFLFRPAEKPSRRGRSNENRECIARPIPPRAQSTTGQEEENQLPSTSCHTSSPLLAGTRLTELDLIQEYRASVHASVDDFHRFLLSLGTSTDGRFWALVACLLSVQCRDSVALEACRLLMADAPGGASDVAALPQTKLEERCRRCNYFKTKASNIHAASRAVLCAGGRVPSTYEGLVALPGVGPKIGNLMRSVAFSDDSSGIVVDTHVHRVATKLGWVDTSDPSGAERTRVQLEGWVPRGKWTSFSLAVVGFGQLTQVQHCPPLTPASYSCIALRPCSLGVGWSRVGRPVCWNRRAKVWRGEWYACALNRHEDE